MGTYIHVHPDLVLFANVSNSQEGIKSPIHSGSSCGAHKERNKSLQKQESPRCVNRNSGPIYSFNFLRQGLAVWLSLTWTPVCRSASVCGSPPGSVWLYRHGHHTGIQGFLPLPYHVHHFNHQKNCHRPKLAKPMAPLCGTRQLPCDSSRQQHWLPCTGGFQWRHHLHAPGRFSDPSYFLRSFSALSSSHPATWAYLVPQHGQVWKVGQKRGSASPRSCADQLRWFTWSFRGEDSHGAKHFPSHGDMKIDLNGIWLGGWKNGTDSLRPVWSL